MGKSLKKLLWVSREDNPVEEFLDQSGEESEVVLGRKPEENPKKLHQASKSLKEFRIESEERNYIFFRYTRFLIYFEPIDSIFRTRKTPKTPITYLLTLSTQRHLTRQFSEVN